MTDSVVFQEFPKLPRLSREVLISEKIDGTNSSLLITDYGDILTGSRTKWVTPQEDNKGFAAWVQGNKEEILKLGPGRHFGEWWGSGIGRGYNLPKGEKRLSLFNISRWALYGTEPKLISEVTNKYQDLLPECIGLVPLIARGIFHTTLIDEAMDRLKTNGSFASPGFMRPEGIIIFHISGNVGFKKTIENDEIPKSLITHE